ncbi:uncharacterized protein BKA55DRAFT_695596 [Fusarium redolens]|uniref:HypA n=1 Tax=Fusarium redolens TaxID=48865 RepID=A0A9P9JU13_FUSRE|nr:uncharacterized protein BKA55DRAFT_695596 [Fusarium redolens]KAH7232170.1 hypothetical protein BKA55DRAFT_695596 [Fusarium redolens]
MPSGSSAPTLLRAGNKGDPAWSIVQNLLAVNHQEYHVFFSEVHDVLLHNHLPHHALTLYSLGATKEKIEWHFNNNTGYQRDQPEIAAELSDSLSDISNFKRHLGDPKEYRNFLLFFRREMERDGYEKAVNRFLFGGDALSNEIFARLFTGFLHPLINAGFGIEFDLPFLVCEGLAMACTQNDVDVVRFMNDIEESVSANQERVSLVEILDLCSSDQKLIDAIPLEPFHILDTEGLLGTQTAKVVDYARRFVVSEDEIALRSAELCNATSVMLAGAQRYNKEPRMDFFIMHATNSSILVDSIVRKSWISPVSKARLLSWFGRFCIILHMISGCPKLDLGPMRAYGPPNGLKTWIDAVESGKEYRDDGHGCKMIRALIHAEQVSRPFENRPEFRMKKSDFEKAALVVASSFLPNDVVSRAGYDQAEAWVRFAGFDSAWEGVPTLTIAEA